jgi:hypothetical protein
LLVALVTIYPVARHRQRRWFIMQSVAYALLLIAVTDGYMTTFENNRSPGAVARAMSEYLRTSGVPVLVSRLPEEAAFYLPLNLRADANASRVLILIDHGRNDPPVEAKRLSNLLNGAVIRGYRRVDLNVPDDNNRYQLFDVIIDRDRA